MSRATFTIGAILLVAVLAAGGLFASNMGFKLNYRLASGGEAVPGGTSNSGTNTLGLPFNRQVGIDNASDLLNDINDGGNLVQQIQRFREIDDGVDIYSGTKAFPTDFALVSGEANYVKMGTGKDYIVVGSHNPSLSISLEAGSDANSNSGTNFYAYPYHSTSARASDLRNEIGAGNVQQVQRFRENDDGVDIYSGTKAFPTDFDLLPGEGYYLKMGTTVNYTPSHY